MDVGGMKSVFMDLKSARKFCNLRASEYADEFCGTSIRRFSAKGFNTPISYSREELNMLSAFS